jgi:hypothetical protein
MYSRKKYNQGRINKSIGQSVDPTSIPTFICPHCGLVKTVNNPYVELTIIDNGKLFMYNKLCGSCAELLKAWVKG